MYKLKVKLKQDDCISGSNGYITLAICCKCNFLHVVRLTIMIIMMPSKPYSASPTFLSLQLLAVNEVFYLR